MDWDEFHKPILRPWSRNVILLRSPQSGQVFIRITITKIEHCLAGQSIFLDHCSEVT